MRLYLDANSIIYAVEAIAPFHTAVVTRMLEAEGTENGALITSRLSRLECRTKPLREGRADLLAAFDQFFSRRLMIVADVSAAAVERATELRARYGFKTPDALHLATAIEERADRFLTGDEGLHRCTEIEVEVLRGS